MPGGADTFTDPQGARTGVWDQWCVYSDRPYVQKRVVEGKEVEQVSILNPETGGVILSNFARSKDDLPGNLGHDKVLTVAFYNAFAEVVGGQVTRFVTHDPSVRQPGIDQLPGGDDGSPPDDGLYWHRARLTRLGNGVKPGMRKCSPEFLMVTKNPHGDDIGPSAVGGAWTNYPFLEGCELNEFERKGLPPMKGKTKFERKMEAAGCDEKDDDATKMSKLRAYEAGQEEAEAAEMQRRMEADAAKKDPEPEKKPAEMEDPTVIQKSPPEIKEPPTAQDEPGAGRSMERLPAGMVAISAERLRTLEAGLQQLPKVTDRLVQMERDRQTERTTAAAQKAVAAAWRKGQIIPRQEETHQAAQDRFLRLFSKGEEAFRDALAPDGSYVVPEAMLVEYERAEGPAAPAPSGRPDESLMALAQKRIEAEEKAGRKLSRLDATRLVCMENPQLAERYGNQSAMELGRRMGLRL